MATKKKPAKKKTTKKMNLKKLFKDFIAKAEKALDAEETRRDESENSGWYDIAQDFRELSYRLEVLDG